jgi:hypothetical protein
MMDSLIQEVGRYLHFSARIACSQGALADPLGLPLGLPLLPLLPLLLLLLLLLLLVVGLGRLGMV